MSAVLSGISIVFAIYFLAGIAGALLLYFAFTSILTVVILVLKYYLYSEREGDTRESSLSENEEEAAKGSGRRNLMIVIFITIAAIVSPMILAFALDPLWFIISISGYAPGISIPEIIIYVYSRLSAK